MTNDECRVQELELLPEGHVLARPAQKIKERVILPRTVNKCDICWVRVTDQKMIRTERGGGTDKLTECLACYVTREHESWN